MALHGKREHHSEEWRKNEVIRVRGKWAESRAKFECWKKCKKQSSEEQIALYQALSTKYSQFYTLKGRMEKYKIIKRNSTHLCLQTLVPSFTKSFPSIFHFSHPPHWYFSAKKKKNKKRKFIIRRLIESRGTVLFSLLILATRHCQGATHLQN